VCVPQRLMKILSWNCRGISRLSAICSLRVLVHDNRPKILFLSETKSSPSLVSSILNQLGFFSMSHVALSGSRGGLVLAWLVGIDLECFITNKNNITTWCFSDPPVSPWILSCIYGPHSFKDKYHFWDSLTFVGENFVSPWFYIGDFNFVLDQSEKLGGRLVASSSSCPFRNFIDQNGLIDLGFAGNPYTWCNNRRGPAIIKERLDRSLASPSWINLHPEFSILHLPACSSDHNPVSLNTAFPSPYLHRPFRFEAFWTKDPSCGLVINSAWSSTNSASSPAHCLVKKLKKTKFALKKWNSLYFGHIQTKIKSTMTHIDKVQQLPPDPSSLALEA
jgi:exonuclease III